MPHGITIDRDNNVFLTDVGLHQVFKFSHDGTLVFAIGEPRVGKWDATHFNQPTDIAIRPDGSFYVSDGYVNSRVALFDRNGRWLREWGKKGAGEGEFSNPHGLTFVPGSTDVIVADRENSRLQLFDRLGAFKRQWVGVKDAQTTGRVFSVAADPAGALYVGIRRADYDTAHTGVLKLDREWKIVAAIGFGKPGDPVFNAVHDLAIGRDGSIYVAETRTKRVVKLRPVTVQLAVYSAPDRACMAASRLRRAALFTLAVGGCIAAPVASSERQRSQPPHALGTTSATDRCARDARHVLCHVSQPADQDSRARARQR